jgi:hypothetical protein
MPWEPASEVLDSDDFGSDGAASVHTVAPKWGDDYNRRAAVVQLPTL